MLERRFNVSVRATGSEHDKPALVGYAAVWNSRSKKIYTRAGNFFYERISPLAFTRALKKGNTVANLYHDMTKPLATVKAGTLRLWEDGHGLAVHAEINPAVSYAMDAWHNAQSRNLSSMSFAFSTPEDGSGEAWDDDEDDDGHRCQYRIIKDVENLQDVAFLTQGTGAYDAPVCDARSLFPDGTPELVETRSSGRVYTVKAALEVVAPLAEQKLKQAARKDLLRRIIS
ncbi:MAG TPA: HK97 family phage prohead protease [Candidatus Udaeobacter sp.]|nr:HK97 family phage prohead protease [Candidatus Udaeobacter sp.]